MYSEKLRTLTRLLAKSLCCRFSKSSSRSMIATNGTAVDGMQHFEVGCNFLDDALRRPFDQWVLKFLAEGSGELVQE